MPDEKPLNRGGVGGQEAELKQGIVPDRGEAGQQWLGDPKAQKVPPGREEGEPVTPGRADEESRKRERERDQQIDQRGGMREPIDQTGERRAREIPDPHPTD